MKKNFIKATIESIKAELGTIVVDDDYRKKLLIRWLNVIFLVTSSVMTVLNIFTSEYVLMASTLAFALLCLANIFISRFSRNSTPILTVLTIVETLALLTFFMVSGIPNGFSAIWIVFVPSFSLLIFGMKVGVLFSGIAMGLMVFLFWTPIGNSFLQFSYTQEFLTRFPILYGAILILAMFVETIRALTQRKLQSAAAEYQYLYRHDALTDMYNRYGFNEIIEKQMRRETPREVSVIMFDIDDFKGINDTYGHSNGDVVLKRISEIMKETVCEHCYCCRWGGEEFTILMSCEHDPLDVSEKIRSKVAQESFIFDGKAVSVTISCGICIAVNFTSETVSDCLRTADDCLYAAKKNGKNRIASKRL